MESGERKLEEFASESEESGSASAWASRESRRERLMKSSSCARRGGGPCEKGERVETRDDARMGKSAGGKVTREGTRA